MSFRSTMLKSSLLAVVLMGLAALPAKAFDPDSPIIFAGPDAITVSFVKAPSLGSGDESGGGGAASEEIKWLKVEFHYAVNPPVPAAGATPTAVPPSPFLDSVEFKVWIEARDLYAADAPGKDGIAVALSGSVTYINMLKNKDAYGVFFVHPSTLARYCTREGVEDFDRKFDIHIEAYVGGKLVDYFNKNKEQDPINWYKPLRPVAGLVLRQDQCPFSVADSDRYPAIKPPAGAAQ